MNFPIPQESRMIDHPHPDSRFTPRRKAAILTLLDNHQLSLLECLERYNLTLDELSEWRKNIKLENYYLDA